MKGHWVIGMIEDGSDDLRLSSAFRTAGVQRAYSFSSLNMWRSVQASEPICGEPVLACPGIGISTKP